MNERMSRRLYINCRSTNVARFVFLQLKTDAFTPLLHSIFYNKPICAGWLHSTAFGVSFRSNQYDQVLTGERCLGQQCYQGGNSNIDILREFPGYNFAAGRRTLKPKNLENLKDLKKLLKTFSEYLGFSSAS